MKLSEPYISFLVTKAHIVISHENDASTTTRTINSRRIMLDVVLDDDNDVQTSQMQSLRNSEWSVELIESEFYNEKVTELNAIGMLLYCKASEDFYYRPESCLASIAFSPIKFEGLLNALQAGRLPEKVTISVLGLTYGREPDGSNIVWDIIANDAAPIMSIVLRVPLAVVPISFSDEPSFKGSEHTPLSSNDLRFFNTSLVKTLSGLSSKIHKSHRLLAILLTALIVVMFLK